ncbi:NAD(P)H-hydrate dehydratase [Caldinitratiruptor microaerophilus]|uniref:Bifunctional NAD(P)H-hydrate repair enzyme n=1 Tax=Caldinitratiruptor microaerophilus TaxID=671077 RepID=A0AA35CNF1_9FIRM|nr:NAD(P)H-hydrate dehydratase [Caldinitratiruptor microaerophilus]BDG62402.1 bifunctional NAD(P)H-hydrate repair enzyme Nnr [Caldinitratiruptor microaerophilus]
MWAVTAEQMRAMEQETQDRYGIPPLALMENAGRAVAEVAWQVLTGAGPAGSLDDGPAFAGLPGSPWLVRVRPAPGLPGPASGTPGPRPPLAPGGRPPRVVVVAGHGNNGGDGLAAARHLHAWGAEVRVLLYGHPDRLTPDARVNFRACQEAGLVTLPLADGRAPVSEWLAQADLVIDALLGTGVRGAPREPVAGAIGAVMAAGRPVLAVDVPSGIDADAGAVPGPAVRAQWTVTFGAPKLGLFLYPAAGLTGEVWVAGIGLPAGVEPPGPAVYPLALPARAGARLPRPGEDAHKGTRGRVLVVGGSRPMPGAVALAAQAALRAGAGLVVAAVPDPAAGLVASRAAEIITHGLPAAADGGFGPGAAEAVLPLVERSVALAVGPGIGQGDWAMDLVRRLVLTAGRPVVLDADGLRAFAARPEDLQSAPAPVVLTPHAGELALLLGTTPEAVQADRPAAVREAARRTGQTVVLKGPHTLVATGGAPLTVWVNLTGNRALATAGSGDVLTGIILGLIGQGMDPREAAVTGVALHGFAADRIAARIAPDGILAGDLLGELPAARAALARLGEEAPAHWK